MSEGIIAVRNLLCFDDLLSDDQRAGIEDLLAEHDAVEALTVSPVWAILEPDGKLGALNDAPLDNYASEREARQWCDPDDVPVRVVLSIVGRNAKAAENGSHE